MRGGWMEYHAREKTEREEIIIISFSGERVQTLSFCFLGKYKELLSIECRESFLKHQCSMEIVSRFC